MTSGAAQARSHAAEVKACRQPALTSKRDWTDYGAAGAEGPQDITGRLIETLQLVDLEDDGYQLGLRGTIDPNARPELADPHAEGAGLRAANRMSDPSWRRWSSRSTAAATTRT